MPPSDAAWFQQSVRRRAALHVLRHKNVPHLFVGCDHIVSQGSLARPDIRAAKRL